jgi:hypothetical protein
LIELLSENILIFLSAYQTVPYVGHSVKKLLITTTKKKHGGSYKASLLTWSENKKGNNSDSYTFIHLDP